MGNAKWEMNSVVDALIFRAVAAKETPHNTAARLAVPFPPYASCKFLDLGAVQKLFVQNAQDEFVSARRRR